VRPVPRRPRARPGRAPEDAGGPRVRPAGALTPVNIT